MLTRSELAKRIYSSSNLKGTFVLRSGALSTEYFDKYLFEADPALLREIAVAMKTLIPDNAEVLAGLELGGVPLAAILSQVTGMPTAFVRKAAKSYGTCKLAEGPRLDDKRVLIIEDVVTSGGQIIQSVAELRKLGAVVSDVLCVIDRGAGGPASLAREDLTLHALFTMTELKASASA
jgi:orotate phosphoribosyltransferase